MNATRSNAAVVFALVFAAVITLTGCRADQASSNSTPVPVLPSADRNLVETVAVYCSNSPDEISKLTDEHIDAIEKRTGNKMSRTSFLNRALDVIDEAKKDNLYPRAADGKFEYAAIAAGINLAGG